MPYKNLEDKRKYQREWRAARRAAFFKDKTCNDCGAAEDLTLDHIDPAMKISHKIWSWSEARRNAELLKCQVLCNDCHKAKTKDKHDRRTHGELNTQAKLTNAMLEEARDLHTSGASYRELGRQYNMSEATIRFALQGKTWKHLQ